MVGPITQKIRLLEGQKESYLQHARSDVAARRATHNAQLEQYDQEIKPLKGKARMASIRENLDTIGRRVGKMGPM